MMKFYKFLLLIFIFGQSAFCLFAQQKPEFDETTDFSVLEKKIKSLEKYPEKAFPYVQIFIDKAKNEADLKKLYRAYDLANSNSTSSNQIKYSDSLIRVAIQLKDNDQIGESFVSSGQVFIANDMYNQALEQTLIGSDYLKINNNPYLVNITNNNLGEIHAYLSQYYEAEKYYEESHGFFIYNQLTIGDTDYRYYYLYSLIGLINAKTRTKKFTEAKKLIEEGKAYVNKNKDFANYLPYFISSEGTNYYYQKNYQKAIEKLDEALSKYNDKWKHLTEKFYLGMSYYHLNQPEKALIYLNQIDADYDETGKLFPEFRPTYEALIDIYKNQDETKKQLFYIDKLLAIDKKNSLNQNQVFEKISRENHQKLLAEKKKLENQQKFGKYSLIGLFAILFCGGFTWRYFSSKKKSNLNNAEITDDRNSVKDLPVVENSIEIKRQGYAEMAIVEEIDYKKYTPIRKETVLQIQQKLLDFEREKKFATPNIKLSTLANDFDVNERYISSVIKIDKDKTFNDYLNGLRLQYFLELIENPNNRSKTMIELSEKIGFITPEMFHKEFQAEFKISAKKYMLEQFA